MSAKICMKLQSALISTGMVQPVSEKAKGRYIEVLCRQVPGQEKGWLLVVDKLLEVMEKDTLGELHVCRRYVRRNGQMVFGWHISLECKTAKALQESIDSLIHYVLLDARPSLEDPSYQRQEPAVVPQAASRAPLAPGRHPPARPLAPRAPNLPGAVIGTPPPGFTPQVRVVQNTRDGNGKVTIVEEMQLPHVYSEMNRPNAKGKGAKFTGGGG